MPPEVLPDAFLCDEECSQVEDGDINIHSWFTHVLPQLRGRGNIIVLLSNSYFNS